MKNQITFLILFIVLCFCSLQAQVSRYSESSSGSFGNQEWTKRYNGPGNGSDCATSIAVDPSGNIYITGYSSNGINMDYATIKYNSSGAQQWIQRYNGPGNGNDKAYSLALDGSGNVCVIGRSDSDFTTIVYNSSGVIKWIRRHQGTASLSVDFVVPSVAADDSGNVYAAGYSSEGGSGPDYVTIKYNSSGVQQWIQTYNGGLMDYEYWLYVLSLAIDHSGNVYVTGAAGTDSAIVSDFATIKYNSSGVQQWVQRYNGSSNSFDGAYSIAVDSSGNVYVTGFSFGGVTEYGYATIKYNSSGVQQWVERYDSPGFVRDIARSVAVDGSGSVYVAGSSINSSGTYGDYTTIKYNSLGVQQWVQTYNNGFAEALAVDSLGNVYVTGYSSNGINMDYATIKYDSSGDSLWVARYNGPGIHDIARSLAVDGSGNVYISGGSYGFGSDYDYATIKYSQTEDISAPSDLNAQSIDSSFIKVTWRDNSNDEDGFYIERTKINDSSHWEVIDAVPQNVNQYSDYFVSRALKYFYRVKAYSGNTFSEYSNIDSAILGGNPSVIPAAPSNLLLIKRTANTIVMNWHDNSGNESGFIIFRKTNGDLFFEVIDSVNTDVVTYQEVGVAPGHNYYYKICSYNSSGISDYSNTLIVLAKSLPVKTPQLSDNYTLYENYPNPFNPVTKINYELRITNYVSLKVYDILGKEILTLVNEKQNAGTYSVEWDAGSFPSGVYFYKLAVDGNIIDTKRMMLLK